MWGLRRRRSIANRAQTGQRQSSERAQTGRRQGREDTGKSSGDESIGASGLREQLHRLELAVVNDALGLAGGALDALRFHELDLEADADDAT